MLRTTAITALFLLVYFFSISFAAQEETLLPPAPTGIVTANANLRSAPSLEGDIIGHAIAGTSLTILNEEGNWYNVRTAEGLIAWIHKSLLTPFSSPERAPVAESPASETQSSPLPPHPSPTTGQESPPSSTSAISAEQTDQPSTPAISAEQADQPSTPAISAEQADQRNQKEEPKPSVPTEAVTKHQEEQQLVSQAEPGGSPPSQIPSPSSLIRLYFSVEHIFLLLLLIILALLILIFLHYRTVKELRRFIRSTQQIPRRDIAENSSLIPISPPLSESQTEFSPLEKAIVEVLRERGEVSEETLTDSLRKKGFAPVLIKAAVAEIIGKTKEQDVPLIKIRYVGGRYFYSLHPTVSV